MKTILEIQKLDRQIRLLNREVDKCPASIDFKNYKKQLTPNKERMFKFLKSQGEDPEKYIRSRIEEIKSKREK